MANGAGRPAAFAKRVRSQIRLQPAIPISIDYLNPRLRGPARAHRALVLRQSPGRPRWQILPLALLQWLNWVVREARVQAKKLPPAAGAELERAQGVPVARQRRQILWLAIAHGIRPLDYYRFGLWDEPTRRNRWRYIFDCEIGTFHALRNHLLDDRPATERSIAKLSDKQVTLDLLAPHGVATSKTIRVLLQGSSCKDLPVDGAQEYFAKPSVGSAARGVFRYCEIDGELVVRLLSGREVLAERATSFVDQRLSAKDYLAQVSYQAHDDFLDLGACANEAPTVRLITEQTSTDVSVRVAFAEIPNTIVTSPTSEERRTYTIMKVDLESGALLAATSTPSGYKRTVDSDLELKARGRTVPHWSQLKADAIASHRQFPGVAAIAWDFIPAPDAAVLLEGNPGWSAAVPQLIDGPMDKELMQL